MRPGVCASVCAAWLAVSFATGAEARYKSDKFLKGPYLQNVSRSSVTVMWESRRESTCRVELLGEDGTPTRSIESEQENVHEVVVNGLESGRRYRYAVDCGSERATGEFATAPDPGAPFMFVVFGDSRSYVGLHRSVVERVRREVPDFILGTGDMVNEGGSREDWQQFFDIERDLLHENVLFPCLGNHDRQGRGRTADNFRKYFAVPENSPNPERYYAFTYSSARFLVLDSNAYSFALTDQTAWIEQQLRAARMDKRIKHIFVSMHHPPYSISLHGGHTQLRDAWTPMFEKYGVAAVFSGHDHNYQRADRHGVHYFVSGGGGAPLYPRSKRASKIDKQAVKYLERTNHYLRVHVIGDYIEVTAFRTDGSVIESMSWGRLPDSKEALLAFAAGAKMTQPELETSMPQDELWAAPEEQSERFGLMGKIGALMVLGAAAVIVVTLKK